MLPSRSRARQLNPNLHFQLSGRKRFILFAPDDWPALFPFPVHHDYDRRCGVDLDLPHSRHASRLRRARGMVVELQPGDVLYIPPYWWHHVQTLTTPCVSMAVWFYDDQSQERDLMPSSGAAMHLASAGAGALGHSAPRPTVANRYGGHFYGLSSGGADVCLTRWVEQVVGMQLDDDAAAAGATTSAAERASKSGEAFGGARKARDVSAWMRVVGRHARGEPNAAGGSSGLPPLRCPFAHMMAQIEGALALDLGGSERVMPWLRKLTYLRYDDEEGGEGESARARAR